MIKSFYRFILIALFLPLVLASCHDEVEAVDDGMEFQMILRIPAGEGEPEGTRGMTRAGDGWTPEDPNIQPGTDQNPLEGEGEGLDYYLTGKDIKLLFCKNDIIIDFAEPSDTKFITAQGKFYEFFVKGKLNRIKAGDGTPYDVVVLANTKGMLQFDQEHLNNLVGSREDAIYPGLKFDFVGRQGIPDIALSFTQNNFTKSTPEDIAADNKAARVPMWGRIENQPLNDGTIITVPIMRSLAKIRIELAESGTGLANASIEKIEMVGASTKGTLMPHDAHHKKTDDTSPWWPDSKNTQGSQNVPTDALHNELPLEFYNDVNNTKYFYVYAPETKNDNGQFFFNVTIKRVFGNDVIYTTYRMNFGEFNTATKEGRYMPVMRNHYYMIKIVGIEQEQLIHIGPWDLEVLPPIMM